MFTNILVAIDGSAHAERALLEATDLAQAYGARLTIMTCVADPSGWEVAGGAYAAIDYPQLREDLDGEARELLQRAAATAPSGVEFATALTHGHPAEQILRQAGTGGHDLVVIGSRGRSGMRSLVLGSTSHQVLNASPRAVLIVHSETSQAPAAVTT